MPIIEVHLLEGRSAREKNELFEGLTVAATNALGVNSGQVRIMIREIQAENFAVAGKIKFTATGKTISEEANVID